jgi:hypothetical protein
MRNLIAKNLLVLGNEMMLFAGAALAIAILICINSIVCMLNFGYGLKPLLLLGDKNQRQESEYQPLRRVSGSYSHVSQRFDLD